MFQPKILIVYLILLLISNNASAQSTDRSSLTEAERLYGLSKVWSEAKYNFVFMDKVKVNWDSLYQATIPAALQAQDVKSYYDVLRGFIAHLQDGHTSVWYPSSFYKTEFVYAPLRTDIIQGKVFITGLLNDSLQQQGIQPGFEVLKINGVNVHDYARKNIQPYEGASTPQGSNFLMYNAYLLAGNANEPLQLTLRDKKGKIADYTISRRLSVKDPEPVQFFVLPNNIGLLTINGFSAPDFNKKFDQLYPELLKTKALIIDLRANRGGNGAQGEYMMKHFVSAPFPDPVISSRQYNPLLKVWGMGDMSFFTMASGTNKPFTDRMIYDKPMAVLISKETGSAAEDFTMPFDYMKRGIIIGQPSAGSTGQPMISSLPGGGTLRICVRKDTYPNGKEFVGVGIQPDILIPENAEAYRNNEDVVLKKAQEILRQKMH
jgi:C-terminal processing protease CtpA/Prc